MTALDGFVVGSLILGLILWAAKGMQSTRGPRTLVEKERYRESGPPDAHCGGSEDEDPPSGPVLEQQNPQKRLDSRV